MNCARTPCVNVGTELIPIIYAAAMLAGGVLWLLHSRVRAALGHGLQCLLRYPALWRIPAAFAIAYGIFQWVAEALLVWRMGEWSATWPIQRQWNTATGWSVEPLGVAIDALDRVATLGSGIIISFPLAAFVVLWVVIFRPGIIFQLVRAIRRRFPRCWVALVIGFSLAAAASATKPVMYLFLPEVLERLPMDPVTALVGASVVNLVSLAFEIFLESYVTVYLMLLAFAWVRGIRANRSRLYLLSARRMGYVLKWTLATTALAMIVVGTMFVESHLSTVDAGGLSWLGAFAQVFYAAVLLTFFPVQAGLVFHNRSLRASLIASIRLMKNNLLCMLLFLSGSALVFLGVVSVDAIITGRIQGISIGLAISAIVDTLSAIIAGWLLASWVCLYRSLNESSRP